jgi:hypothetical protein
LFCPWQRQGFSAKNIIVHLRKNALAGKLSALEIFSAADNNLEMIREGTRQL